MKKTLAMVLVASLGLSACSSWRDSRANPSNWFGRSQPAAVNVDSTGDVNPLLPAGEDKLDLAGRPDAGDPTFPITQVTELKVDATSTGAIIRATGVAQREGAFRAELRRNRSEEDAQNGVLTYTFRVAYPAYATAGGTERTRSVNAAHSVSNETLEGIRVIRVVSETNALETRRR